MTPEIVRGEIDQLISSLLKKNLAIAINSPIIITNRHRVMVTWPLSSERDSRRGRFEFASLQDYMDALRTRNFTCVLYDGALVQIAYEFDLENVITAHSLSYYPCPVVFDPAELRPEDDLDALVTLFLEDEFSRWLTRPDDSSGVGVLERVRLRSPVRFDFNKATARPGHSASHVHISHDDCRISVYGPLSVGHFVRFVFRHFYNSDWITEPYLQELPKRETGERTIAPTDQEDLFFECD